MTIAVDLGRKASKQTKQTNKVGFYLSYAITITLKSHFFVKTLSFCHYVCNVVMNFITFSENLLTTSGLLILLHGFISLIDGTSYDKRCLYPTFMLKNRHLFLACFTWLQALKTEFIMMWPKL